MKKNLFLVMVGLSCSIGSLHAHAPDGVLLKTSKTVPTRNNSLLKIQTFTETGEKITATGILTAADITAIRDQLLENPSIKIVDLSAAQLQNGVLPAQAFMGVKVDEIILPSNLSKIGYKAFLNASLNKLDLSVYPELSQIEFSAFGNLQLTEKNVLDLSSNNKLTNSPIHWDGRGMFSDYSGRVILPKTLIELSPGTFSYSTCTFELPETLTKIGNYAFKNYKGSQEIKLPNSVESIGDYAFSGLTLKSIFLPSSLKTIGYYAFTDTEVDKLDFSICPNLTTISGGAFINLKLTNEDVLDFSTNSKITHSPVAWKWKGMFTGYNGHVILPKAMTVIPNAAFGYYTGTFELPEGIIEIGNAAFFNYNSLQIINLPNTLQKIGAEAFSSYKPETDLVIPNSVTDIGNQAFYLGEFNNFSLPANLKSIGSQAFSGTKLNKLDFSVCPDLTQIGFNAFENIQFAGENVLDFSINNKLTHSSIAYPNKGMFTGYTGHVIMPKGMTVLPDAAFGYFTGTFELPETLTKIGNYTFNTYKSTHPIKLPNSIETIGVGAFHSAVIPTPFKLPSKLKTIEGLAFVSANVSELNFAESPELEQLNGRVFTNISLEVLDFSKNTPYLKGSGGGGFGGPFANYTGRVILPENLKVLSNYMFFDFKGSVDLPNSIETIETNAFLNAKISGTFKLPSQLKHIGSGAFNNSTLSGLNFEESPLLEKIGGLAFSGITFQDTLDFSKLSKQLVLYNAGGHGGPFAGFPGHVIIPHATKVLTSHAFHNFKGSATLNEGLQKIETNAFINSKIKEITFPASVTSIGSNIFYGNDQLVKITSNNPEPPTLTANAFNGININACELIVPEGSNCLYGNREQWKNFYSEPVKSCLEANADVISRGPNSYIFDIDLAKRENKGGLLIPVSKAYATWLKDKYLNKAIPQGKLSASLHWEDVKGLVKSVKLLPAVNPEESRIEVMINKAKGKGNAVVAFHVGDTGTDKDSIYWSWHVWVTDDPTQGLTHSLDKAGFISTFMDRNLGALGNSFLGHGWTRTGGLHYQWGRKDPFPPQRYPDGNVNYTFLNPVSNPENKSVVYNNSYINDHNTRTEITHTILEPGETSEENIRYAVQHPYHFISLKEERLGNYYYSWYTGKNGKSGRLLDLWSSNDPYKGAAAQNYKKFELKSVFDPCPSGWRVPPHASRNGIVLTDKYGNEQHLYHPLHSPWAGIATKSPIDGIRSRYPGHFPGVKVYPGLGFDFTNETNNYHIGKYSLTGRYLHAGGRLIYQDQNSESFIWSATLGNSQNYGADPNGSGGGFTFHLIANSNNQFNVHYLFPFEHPQNTVAQAVRCGRDPRATDLTDYPTFYVDARERDYTEGLDNPNTYLVKDKDTEINIPINKAYSVYNQYLTDHQWPTGNLSVNVYWTTNQNLVKNVSLEGIDETGTIKVDLNPQEKGNAVVSLHMGNNGNSLDPVLWSWHLWAPNGNPEDNTITYTTEEKYHKDRKNPEDNAFLAYNTESGGTPLTTTFMDRNLGALEYNVASEDPSIFSKTGGMYYQWGRKDPIPGFRNVGYEDYSYRGYNIFTGSNETGKIEYKTLNRDLYNKNHAKAVDFNKTKTTASALKLAAERPLDIFYNTQNATISWVPEIEYNKNLWGHAEKKSPFDPCPSGWRVPDFGYKGGNNSPWYKEGTYHDASQVPGNSGEGVMAPRQGQEKASVYGAKSLGSPYNVHKGINFNEPDYNLGLYPGTGFLNYTKLKNGKNELIVTYPGNIAIWSATMTGWDDIAAKAIYHDVDSRNYVVDQKFNPSSGLNVRCAKDLPRFTEESIENSNKVTKIQKTELQRFSTITNEVKKGHFLYPNPVSDYLYIDTDNAVEYKIYNFSRNLVQQGKFVNKHINVSNLAPGVYVIQLMDKTNNQVYSVNITKK